MNPIPGQIRSLTVKIYRQAQGHSDALTVTHFAISPVRNRVNSRSEGRSSDHSTYRQWKHRKKKRCNTAKKKKVYIYRYKRNEALQELITSLQLPIGQNCRPRQSALPLVSRRRNFCMKTCICSDRRVAHTHIEVTSECSSPAAICVYIFFLACSVLIHLVYISIRRHRFAVFTLF